MSSMLSAPATIPITSEATFSPADDTRFGSSNTAEVVREV